jgi:polar amino acid transport system substrate-binding protein
MKKVLLTLVSLFAIFLLVACGSNDNKNSDDSSTNDDDGLLAKLQAEGKITVGFADEEPYGHLDANGELTGASVETAKAVFAELGIDEVEGQLADYAQLVPGLGAGKFDAITSGMAITPDRCESAIFSEPDMKYGEGLIVQKGNPLDLHSYEDIANNPDATISIMSGATEIDFVASEGVTDRQVQSAPDIAATIAAVESGRADATTGTEMTLIMALESANSDNLEFVEDFEQPDIAGVPSYGAVAFHPDNTELRDAFNEKLAVLKEDGTIQKILEANGFDPERNYPEDNVTTEMVCNGEE